MEAGYDYLLLRGRRHLFSVTAVFLLVFGGLLLAGGGAYYAYAAIAKGDLDQLNASLPEPGRTAPEGSDIPDAPARAVAPPPGISPEGIAGQGLTWTDPLEVDAWSSPLEYEPRDYRQQMLLQGFLPLEQHQAWPVGSQSPATRIIVPALGIDSRVNPLEIRDLGDSRAYETPVNSVGHIPQSANPGEAGSSWFFGHLESPTIGEGSVFFHLPKIAEMIRNGEEVLVITDNGFHQYLYRISSTEVVHENDMKLYDNGDASIHLVACVPRLTYDHRLIVTGELVGVK
jgi:LPXTG-site transpeptidase (sortase) family protein